MSYIQVLQLISFAFLMSGGQVLFKKTALSISAGLDNENSLGLIEGILKAATIPWLYMALFTYGIATLFWLYILQRIPLTLAYPFSALAMIIVPILAIFLFGEKLNWSYWIGIIFIFIGATIIAR